MATDSMLSTLRPSALIVEDHDVIRACVAAWLTNDGWAVHSSPSAEEALTLARVVQPQFALIDVQLSGSHDGLWLAGQLQATVPSARVLFATGSKDLPGSATLRANVSGYLVKPYSHRDLTHALSTLPCHPLRLSAPPAWPPATQSTIDARRRDLLRRIHTALEGVYAADEQLAAALMPGLDTEELARLRDDTVGVARWLRLDTMLIDELERAVCFGQLGRVVFPDPAHVPELSVVAAQELIERHYPEESFWAMSALGMPVAGELVTLAGDPETLERSSPTTLEVAARVLHGMLLWREMLALHVSRGLDRHSAAIESAAMLKRTHAAVDPRVAEALTAVCALERSSVVN